MSAPNLRKWKMPCCARMAPINTVIRRIIGTARQPTRSSWWIIDVKRNVVGRSMTRLTPLVRPVSQRTLKKPRAVGVEIVDAGDIDRDAARRDGLCDSIDLRLDRAGIFGGPRAGGAKLDPIAARLATEQDACRHRTAPSSMAQHHAPTLDPSRADEPRQDWMRCGGTLRLRAKPIGRRWAQLKSRTERNLSPRPSLLKVNKSVVILKRRLPF